MNESVYLLGMTICWFIGSVVAVLVARKMFSDGRRTRYEAALLTVGSQSVAFMIGLSWPIVAPGVVIWALARLLVWLVLDRDKPIWIPLNRSR
jgi:hypothetical protein